MSRSLQRGGFSHSDATARHTNRKSTRMNRKTDPVSADLKRIHGLYRRWELPEILKDQRAYRIENAGAHQDGTPLVAVYADADAGQRDDQHNASTTDTEAASRPAGTMSRRPE